MGITNKIDIKTGFFIVGLIALTGHALRIAKGCMKIPAVGNT